MAQKMTIYTHKPNGDENRPLAPATATSLQSRLTCGTIGVGRSFSTMEVHDPDTIAMTSCMSQAQPPQGTLTEQSRGRGHVYSNTACEGVNGTGTMTITPAPELTFSSSDDHNHCLRHTIE
ncbi:hypothetical protein PoB_002383700 [Plakobranchus ocellatus]|uniref:Uncharacterized protein n=1 Tax=Plakobranchus ocellatus TaxID=259542 RepID=A0AAV3ZRP4_9GAST|nr:hypothetical protein PoB_002383700 [Plakobranchus ocellatus]